jgi:hypothetical protein
MRWALKLDMMRPFVNQCAEHGCRPAPHRDGCRWRIIRHGCQLIGNANARRRNNSIGSETLPRTVPGVWASWLKSGSTDLSTSSRGACRRAGR